MESIAAEQEVGDGADARASILKAARFTPLLIVLYFALHLVIRLCLSSNLEVDDAEMVGQTGWALGYANSHPPLYHWIVRLCYEMSGNWAAATAIPKFALLAGGYLLVLGAARRASASDLAGALAVAALLFIPVVAWKTEGKLTHSVLGFTATAATVYALVLVLMRGRISDFVWLGIAATAGLLAKYNFVLVLAAMALAILAVPEARRAFVRRRAWLVICLPLLLTMPHLLWIRSHPQLAAQRLYMLKTGGGPLGLNLRAASVSDGLLSLALVILVATAPALLVFTIAQLRSRRAEPHPFVPAQSHICRVLGIWLLAELIIFILVVVTGGFTQVHERYLVVLLPPFPVWLALRFRAAEHQKSWAAVLATGAAVAVFLTVARPLSVVRGASRLAFPYQQWAAELAAQTTAPISVLGDIPENAANLAIHLPEGTVYGPGLALPESVLIVAENAAELEQLADALGEGYRPAGEPQVLSGPLRWNRAHAVSITAQLRRRTN